MTKIYILKTVVGFQAMFKAVDIWFMTLTEQVIFHNPTDAWNSQEHGQTCL